MNVMQYPGTDLTYGTVPEPHAQIRLFFGLLLYLARKYCKNLKVPEAQISVNRTRAKSCYDFPGVNHEGRQTCRLITWFVSITIYCTFFNNNSPPPRQFLCYKILSKKISYSNGNVY